MPGSERLNLSFISHKLSGGGIKKFNDWLLRKMYVIHEKESSLRIEKV